MHKLLLAIISLITSTLAGQSLNYFNLVPPELGGDHGAGNLVIAEADSASIFVMGHITKAVPNVTKNIHPILATVNYDGTIRSTEVIVDTGLHTIPFNNGQMIKKNDSVYYKFFYVKNIYNPNLASYALVELNIRQNKILRKKIFYDNKTHDNADIFTSTQVKAGLFHLVLQEYDKMIPNRYLYEMDLNLNVLKTILIKYHQPYLAYRWVSKGESNTYELIVEQLIFKGINNPSGKGFLTYLKIDSIGNVIKKKQLPDTGNIFNSTAESYTILRSKEGGFVIGCLEVNPNPPKYLRKPLVIKTSSEFDSIIWKTKLYPFSDWVEIPEFFITSLVAMNDSTGYVLGGYWIASPLTKPDFGMLYKVSLNGDSLWTHKYQPLGWDSLRSLYLKILKVNITPYNTIVAVGIASDRDNNWQKPWILHLNSDGCLIPDCKEYVSTKEIESDKDISFKLHPNLVRNELYLFSRISAKNLHMQLINLQGKVLLQNKLSVESGVQYIIDIPSDIPSSSYLFRMVDAKGDILLNKKISVAR